MRTTAGTRHTPADLTSAPRSLDWARYIRDQHIKLSASARSLSLLLITLGQGQHISMSVTKIADSIGMKAVTVRDALRELQQHELLAVKGPGPNQTTIYRLTLPVQAQGSTEGDHLGSTEGDHLGSTEGDHQVVPNGTTTSIEDQEEDDDLHQHPGDDVGGTSSRSNRAKGSARPGGDLPPVEDYIADIEGPVVDELERRLGLDPGTVNVKALAKTWRGLYVRYPKEPPEMVSDLLRVCPASDRTWADVAEKDNPVGYMMFRVEQAVAKSEDEVAA